MTLAPPILAVLMFASILLYGFLMFTLGIKAGREIRVLIKTLDAGLAKRGELNPPSRS